MFYEIKIYDNNIKRINSNCIEFNFFHSNETLVDPILPEVSIPNVFYDFFTNNLSYFKDIMFQGYIFNTWSNYRKDVPNVVQKKVYHIDTKLKVVNLNLSYLNSKDLLFSLKDTVSKVIGLMYADYVGFENLNYMRKVWEDLRGNLANNTYTKLELFAEDFKVLFCKTRGYYTLDNFDDLNYKTELFQPAKNILGLKDLMIIWKPFLDYQKRNKFTKLIIDRQVIFNGDSLGIIFLEKEFRKLLSSKFSMKKLINTGLYEYDIKRSDYYLLRDIKNV